MKDEGKIRHIGVCNVTEPELRRAQALTPVVSVQNRYNVGDRSSEDMLDLCSQEQIVFIPWAPIQQTDDKAAVRAAAERLGVDPRQVVLAWMLQHSPAMLPIPGTGSPKHLEGNVAAASLELTGQEQEAIATGG
jgi:aryl-alcohol dehydrogenase-like predicted oxidoreductase